MPTGAIAPERDAGGIGIEFTRLAPQPADGEFHILCRSGKARFARQCEFGLRTSLEGNLDEPLPILSRCS